MEIIVAILFLLLLIVIINSFLIRRKRYQLSDLDRKFTKNQHLTQTFKETLAASTTGDVTEDVESYESSEGEVQQEIKLREKLSDREDTPSSVSVDVITEQRKDETIDLVNSEPSNEEVLNPRLITPLVNSSRDNKVDPVEEESTDQITPENLLAIDQVDEENISDSELIEDATRIGPPDIVTNTQIKKETAKPKRYKAPVLMPATRTRTQSSTEYQPVNNSRNESRFPIAVRIYFQRGNSVNLSLLLGRGAEISDIMDLVWLGQEINLVSLTDEWFEGVSLPEIGRLLETGIEWEATTNDGKSLRWSLSGRSLYVLAASNALSGFIATTRLVIGKEHVVLCRQELLKSVDEVIFQTESPTPEVIGPDAGLPEGWVCLRNVAPRKPVRQSESQDILNILRPLPDIEIALEGGVRIEDSIWLAGYPPKITLRGDLAIVDRVVIDGIDATVTEHGTYTTPNWDQPGDHGIWVAGQNKSYAIREIDGNWEVWQAHRYNGKKYEGESIGICGPLVFKDTDSTKQFHPTIVPVNNPVLVGPVPGQILNLERRLGANSSVYGDFAPFQVVWALPSNPYHADKHTTSILYMGSTLTPGKVRNLLQSSIAEKDSMWAWSNIILAASRKRLECHPDSPEIKSLWGLYKKQAKAIWRRLK